MRAFKQSKRHADVGRMAQPQRQQQQQLRPGWYPDPDGDMCYRKFDGRDWSDETRDVPAAARAKFVQQQQALQRRMGIAPTKPQRGGHLSQVHGRQATVDPGQGFAIAAFVMSIVFPWLFIPLILARMSRTRSNAADFPRNGFALAAIIITWIQYVLVGLYVLFVFGLLAFALGAGVKEASSSTTAATKSIRTAVGKIEECASSNRGGGYAGCVGAGPRAPVDPCRPTRPLAGTTCADPIGRQGFVVRSTSSEDALFVERHAPNGTVTRTCAPETAFGCMNGRWS
jgi:hypothetical protein